MTNDDLYHLIRTEECCLWIGAGFSMYAGYPNGTKLKQILFDTLRPDEQSQVDINQPLKDFTQSYQLLKSRPELLEEMRKIFTQIPISTEDHDLLAKFAHFRTIITTNYDHLIEGSYSPDEVQIITSDVDISTIKSSKTQVYKIHGDIYDLENLVLTSDDYSAQHNRNFKNPFWARIISELSTKHVIFLGYGYKDENIKADFDYIYSKLKDKGKKRILIAPSMSSLDAKYLEQNGINFIQGTGRNFLDGLLPELKKHLVSDVKNGHVSSDVAIKFAHNFGLNLGLKASDGKSAISKISKSDGSLIHQHITISAAKPEVVDKLNKFHNSYDQMSISIKPEELHDFSSVAEGIDLNNLNDFGEFWLAHTPTGSGKCQVEFVNKGVELEVEYELFHALQGERKIIAKLFGFTLTFHADYKDTASPADLGFEIEEPTGGGRSNVYRQVFQAIHWLFMLEPIKIYRDSKTTIDYPLDTNEKINDFAKYVNAFEAVQRIEKEYGCTFTNLKINNFTSEAAGLMLILTRLMDDGFYNVDIPDGHQLPLHYGIIEQLKNPPGQVFITMGTWELELFGQLFQLGRQQLGFLGPSISEVDKLAKTMTITSSNKQMVVKASKFGLIESPKQP